MHNIFRAARRLRASLAPLVLLAGLLAIPVPASAAPEGSLTWGVHVSLAPTFFDPAEATGTALPLMVHYAMHDALVRPMTGVAMGTSLAEEEYEGRQACPQSAGGAE